MIPQTWLIGAGVVLAVGIGAGIKGYGMGSNAVQAEWDAERVRLAAEVQAAAERVRNIENHTVEQAAQQRERADETVRTIERRHRVALERLRQQAGGNGDGSVSGGAAAELAECAAAGLADRDVGVDVSAVEADREWLLTYARDAAVLQAAFDACVAQHNAVRQAHAD